MCCPKEEMASSYQLPASSFGHVVELQGNLAILSISIEREAGSWKPEADYSAVAASVSRSSAHFSLSRVSLNHFRSPATSDREPASAFTISAGAGPPGVVRTSTK